MQLLAIAIAASLVIGPAPVSATEQEGSREGGETETPAEDDAALSLPDVDESPEADDQGESEAEPEVEPDPDPPAPVVESVEPSVEQAPVVRDRLGCDQSKSCRRMTIAGIVVGTVGLAAVGTGIGLLVKRDEVIPESPTFVTSTRPPGVVTVTIGAGVTLTAVLMLVAAHRGYKRHEGQARVELLGNGLRF